MLFKTKCRVLAVALGMLPCFGTAKESREQLVSRLVGLGPRPAGSHGEARAAEFVATRFRSMGLSVQVEPFDSQSFEVDAASLRIKGRTFAPVYLGWDPYKTPLTPTFETFSTIDSKQEEPEGASVKGKIVLTPPGVDPGQHFRLASLGAKGVVSVSETDFRAIQRLKATELLLTVRGDLRAFRSRNVVARIGPATPERFLLVGAHLDAHRKAPGANDNATGIAAMLELADRFRTMPLPPGLGITFAAFGAEELGVLGSRSFVARHAEELARCEAALILDNLGGEGPVLVERDGGSDRSASPGTSRLRNPYLSKSWEGRGFPWRLLPPPDLFAAIGGGHRPPWLVDSLTRVVERSGVPFRFTGLQGSDQMAFAQAGIPTTGVSAPSPLDHTERDIPVSINQVRFAQCVEVATRILEEALAHFRQGTPR